MIYKFIVFAAALISFLLSGTVRGSQFIPLSVDELTARSSIVLHGTVVSKTCLRDGEGRIYTRVEVAVSDVWKGNVASNRFTIVQGGGILGEEKVTVSGQVEYRPGEEMVAFLVLNQRGEGVTLGLMQGKFEVHRETTTGAKYARNLFHGRGSEKIDRAAQPQTGTGRLALSELKRRVQETKQ